MREVAYNFLKMLQFQQDQIMLQRKLVKHKILVVVCELLLEIALVLKKGK